MNSFIHFWPWSSLHSSSVHLRTVHILTTIYFPSPHLTLTSPHLTSPSLHLTSRHVTLPHLTSLHFTAFCDDFSPPHLHFASFITFLTLFLKFLHLQKRDPKTSAGSWFQSRMVLFTMEYFPISVFCFLLLIFLSWSTLLCNLSPIAFQARSLVYALKRAHMRPIFLCSVKVSQFESFLWCASVISGFKLCVDVKALQRYRGGSFRPVILIS
jgi:hypothetical protein